MGRQGFVVVVREGRVLSCRGKRSPCLLLRDRIGLSLGVLGERTGPDTGPVFFFFRLPSADNEEGNVQRLRGPRWQKRQMSFSDLSKRRATDCS